MMGNIYPVTESPIPNDPNSLLGKPNPVEGYDSHYVIVKQPNNSKNNSNSNNTTNDSKQSTNSVYFPCKPEETPDYDEIVVFSKSQILPRYIVHYEM